MRITCAAKRLPFLVHVCEYVCTATLSIRRGVFCTLRRTSQCRTGILALGRRGGETKLRRCALASLGRTWPALHLLRRKLDCYLKMRVISLPVYFVKYNMCTSLAHTIGII
jgi:hypothetical protein